MVFGNGLFTIAELPQTLLGQAMVHWVRNDMRVLALTSYPIEAAATRYRLAQFVGPLAERGITLTIRPFLNTALFQGLYDRRQIARTTFGLLKSGINRIRDLFAARAMDVILVQREAMILGPPWVEWLMSRVCSYPMVLDLDDATYLSYTSPTYGRAAKLLKWFRKTDDLIRWSRLVTCGNRAIAEYVTEKGAIARIIPTVVDTELFRPVERWQSDEPLVLGWVGTHSTFPYLVSIFPVLQDLAQRYRFRLKVVGAGEENIHLSGVKIENLKWELEREVSDFQSIDIGLYPIDASLYSSNWAAAKSGFKAIQYMAVGIPYVASPVGAAAEIGEVGKTHFLAQTPDEWHNALACLISDAVKRRTMGAAARDHAITHYAVPAQADKLAEALRAAVGAGQTYAKNAS
jgi:glycosyltransferase involved in cell wall biosynthesis